MGARSRFGLPAIAAVLYIASLSSAALLGIVLTFPAMTYNSTGTTQYNATTHVFSITASPLQIRFSPTTPPRQVNPTGFPPEEVVQINLFVDNAGALEPGVPLPYTSNFKVVGEVDEDGNGSIDYAGVLLTGDIVAFGFQDSGTPGAADQFEFRFTLTGGMLASLYAGSDIGIKHISEGSSFTNSFEVDFSGQAKGDIGPICNPPCTITPQSQSICLGSSATLTAVRSPGSGPYTYS